MYATPRNITLASIATVLLAFAPAVSAEWVKIYEDGGSVGYIDPSTIKKVNDNLRRVSELLDFKKPDPQFRGEMSHLFLVEYDCKSKAVRIVSVTGHAERMAKGRITNSATPKRSWSPIDPRSHHMKQLRMVCAG
jgi:hypothetical protein